MQTSRTGTPIFSVAFRIMFLCHPSGDVPNALGRDSTGFRNLESHLVPSSPAGERPFTCHQRTGSDSEKESILLPVEIDHYLIHRHLEAPTDSLEIIGCCSLRPTLSLLVHY